MDDNGRPEDVFLTSIFHKGRRTDVLETSKKPLLYFSIFDFSRIFALYQNKFSKNQFWVIVIITSIIEKKKAIKRVMLWEKGYCYGRKDKLNKYV